MGGQAAFDPLAFYIYSEWLVYVIAWFAVQFGN